MSSDVAIRTSHLSKSYSIRSQGIGASFRDIVAERVRRPMARAERRTVWALDDVSLEIRQGEAVGIVGANGTGKSTLLKVISRITAPTRGRVDTFGRVGSLLEVGTGFHPELTGRENVFLNGAILGMRSAEVSRQFDAIVDFAGVGQYIDTPVKRYSTGMMVRLAFAVAAHLDADILLVDEVLAVGDAEFQKRSLAQMNEVAGRGRTVVFVSHSLSAVTSLCTSAIFLRRGKMAFQGPTAEAIALYLDSLGGEDASAPADTRGGTGELRLGEVVALKAIFSPGEPKVFDLVVEDRGGYHGQFFVTGQLLDYEGRTLAHMDSRLLGVWFPQGTRNLTFQVNTPWLKPGRYVLNLFVCHSHGIFDAFYGAATFEVSPDLPYEGLSVVDTGSAAVLGDFAVTSRG